LRTFGRATSSAVLTRGVTRQRHGFCYTLGCFFQIERHVTAQIRTAPYPGPASPTSKEVFEDRSAENVSKGFKNIRNIPEAATRATLGARMTKTIVSSPLLGIAKNLVSLRSLLELVNRLGIPLIRIRVIFQRQLAISLRYLVLRSRLADSEHFVQITLRLG
jgi:hypothetical protein